MNNNVFVNNLNPSKNNYIQETNTTKRLLNEAVRNLTLTIKWIEFCFKSKTKFDESFLPLLSYQNLYSSSKLQIKHQKFVFRHGSVSESSVLYF